MSDKKLVLPETEPKNEKDKDSESSDKPLTDDTKEDSKADADKADTDKKVDKDKTDDLAVSTPTPVGSNTATIILLAVLLVVASITLYYVWRSSQSTATKTATTEPTATSKVATKSTDTTTSVTATTAPTASTKKSLAFETALNAKDYNAMKTLIASNVNFVLDATECCGDTTADKAITQLKSRIEDAGIDTYNFSAEQQIIKNMKVNQPQAFSKWNNIGISGGKDFFAYNLDASGKVSEIIMGFTDTYDLD